jgi:prepilin-type N-terminal cleavage/methylation domain-containing protein
MSTNVNLPARHRDAGMSLVELLVSIVISGTLVTAIALGFSVIARNHQPTLDRVAESKDISFIQAWIPVDLASSVTVDTSPTAQPAANGPAAVTLPGTNVMTIERKDLTIPNAPNYLVAYRYVNVGDEWQLIRYEIKNPGLPTQTVESTGVAHELAPPPAGWSPDKEPTHAIDVQGRNALVVLRKSGMNINVTFRGGDEYSTGGAGLGPGDTLPDASGGFVDPKSPPSRCGGNLTLVLDRSGSIGTALPLVKAAAKSIIDNFQGTPTRLRIVTFETNAAAFAPPTWNAAPIDMLNLTDSAKTTLKDQIDAITLGNGTNWEAGLRMAMTDWTNKVNILKSPNAPDTVIFVTDGDPTRYLTNTGSAASGQTTAYYYQQAKEVSDKKAEFSVTMKGIYVYAAAAPSTSSQDRLKGIVGPVEWDGKPFNEGNAKSADFFTGSFDQLGDIFQEIFAGDCGGTVTIQKRFDNGGVISAPSAGIYHYSTAAPYSYSNKLNASLVRSLTFDFPLDNGAIWVPINEDPITGYALDRVECYVRGTLVPTRVRSYVDAQGQPVTNGREIQVIPNEAMSCLFISVPA